MSTNFDMLKFRAENPTFVQGNVKALKSGTYTVEKIEAEAKPATPQVLQDGTVRPVPQILGMDAPMLSLTLTLNREVEELDSNNQIVTSVDTNNKVVGSKRILLSNILQLRKLFVEDGYQLSIKPNRIHYHFQTGSSLQSIDVGYEIDPSLVEAARKDGANIIALREDEHYLLLYVSRAGQGLELEPNMEVSRVIKKPNMGMYFELDEDFGLEVTV